MNPNSVRALLAGAVARLRAADVPDPARDARRLIAHVVGTLAPGPDEVLAPDVAARFEQLVERRARREPVSHILGCREFWGRNFNVSGDVLDPRPETETLIEEALREPFSTVLDLGTGSGAILLTLLAERSGSTGLGTDISEAALQLAGLNATAIGVDGRATLRRADWFEGVNGPYDLIVANPPYIAREEMDGLAAELSFEPRNALTDDADGLTAYRAIAKGAADRLAPGGRLLVEIGHTQGEAVAKYFNDAGLSDVAILQDLDGRDRVVAARSV